MANNKEIDSNLLRFFYENEVLIKYANEELEASQIDESRLNF